MSCTKLQPGQSAILINSHSSLLPNEPIAIRHSLSPFGPASIIEPPVVLFTVARFTQSSIDDCRRNAGATTTNDWLLSVDTLTLEELPQLITREQCACLRIQQLGVGNVDAARYVTT